MNKENVLKGPAEEFADLIRARLGARLRQLILFGSRARGDAEEDSDYDCLVVVDEVDHFVAKAIDQTATQILLRRGAVISGLPVSEKDIRGRPYEPLFINARKEGILL